MQGTSRKITTNQTGIHEKLLETVSKHLHHRSKKPFSQHTIDAFKGVQSWLNGWSGQLILDSCCGVGESTQYLAKQYPEAKIIGVDKSASRVLKHDHYRSEQSNYIIVQAELTDFWRLAVADGWCLDKHYLLYPNPYPKASQLSRRWYAQSAFADILRLQGELIVRSNWKLYVEEFCHALAAANIRTDAVEYSADVAMTPFERKYWQSGQTSWQLNATLNNHKIFNHCPPQG